MQVAKAIYRLREITARKNMLPAGNLPEGCISLVFFRGECHKVTAGS